MTMNEHFLAASCIYTSANTRSLKSSLRLSILHAISLPVSLALNVIWPNSNV